MKKLRYWYATSTSGLPPCFLWSSMVTWPPLKAYLLIFFWICFGVSVMKIAVVSSEALIFVVEPCKAGKNLEWIKDGLANFSLSATSLHTLK